MKILHFQRARFQLSDFIKSRVGPNWRVGQVMPIKDFFRPNVGEKTKQTPDIVLVKLLTQCLSLWCHRQVDVVSGHCIKQG